MKDWEVCVHYKVRTHDDEAEQATDAVKDLLAGGDGGGYVLDGKIASVREVRPASPAVNTRGKEVRESRLAAWQAGVAYARSIDLPATIFEEAARLDITDRDLITEFLLGVKHVTTMANFDRLDREREARDEPQQVLKCSGNVVNT